MIAIDTNILVYAHREDSIFHKKAFAAIKHAAESSRDWAIPWPCLYEFFAIVTHPGIYKPPTPLEDALIQIECWLESPTLYLLGEANNAHWSALKAVIGAGKITGAQVHDAKIAVICIKNEVAKLWTADRDFSRFPQLKTENPLLLEGFA